MSDLRSVSQLANHDRGGMRNGFADTKPQWPSSSGQQKYRSEQNLASPDSTDGGKKPKKIPKAKLRVMSHASLMTCLFNIWITLKVLYKLEL